MASPVAAVWKLHSPATSFLRQSTQVSHFPKSDLERLHQRLHQTHKTHQSDLAKLKQEAVKQHTETVERLTAQHGRAIANAVKTAIESTTSATSQQTRNASTPHLVSKQVHDLVVQGKDRDIERLTKELASLKTQHQSTTSELSRLQIELLAANGSTTNPGPQCN